MLALYTFGSSTFGSSTFGSQYCRSVGCRSVDSFHIYSIIRTIFFFELFGCTNKNKLLFNLIIF